MWCVLHWYTGAYGAWFNPIFLFRARFLCLVDIVHMYCMLADILLVVCPCCKLYGLLWTSSHYWRECVRAGVGLCGEFCLSPRGVCRNNRHTVTCISYCCQMYCVCLVYVLGVQHLLCTHITPAPYVIMTLNTLSKWKWGFCLTISHNFCQKSLECNIEWYPGWVKIGAVKGASALPCWIVLPV